MEKTDDALWSRGVRENRQYQVVLQNQGKDANRPLRLLGLLAAHIMNDEITVGFVFSLKHSIMSC